MELCVGRTVSGAVGEWIGLSVGVDCEQEWV